MERIRSSFSLLFYTGEQGNWFIMFPMTDARSVFARSARNEDILEIDHSPPTALGGKDDLSIAFPMDTFQSWVSSSNTSTIWKLF
jgi:hypothetical protein